MTYNNHKELPAVLKVTVEPRDIREGQKYSCELNPVARAFRRQHRGPFFPLVKTQGVTVASYNSDDGPHVEYAGDERFEVFVRNFDGGRYDDLSDVDLISRDFFLMRADA